MVFRLQQPKWTKKTAELLCYFCHIIRQIKANAKDVYSVVHKDIICYVRLYCFILNSHLFSHNLNPANLQSLYTLSSYTFCSDLSGT